MSRICECGACASRRGRWTPRPQQPLPPPRLRCDPALLCMLGTQVRTASRGSSAGRRRPQVPRLAQVSDRGELGAWAAAVMSGCPAGPRLHHQSSLSSAPLSAVAGRCARGACQRARPLLLLPQDQVDLAVPRCLFGRLWRRWQQEDALRPGLERCHDGAGEAAVVRTGWGMPRCCEGAAMHQYRFELMPAPFDVAPTGGSMA